MARFVQNAEKVLDVGCGDMPNPYLTNAIVIGLDLQKSDPKNNYTNFVIGDVMNLPAPFKEKTFDAIIAGEIIEHLERPVDFLRNCHATLKDGGKLVLSTPNPNNIFERILTISLNTKYFYSKQHVMLYPQRWLIRMMQKSGFKNIQLYSGGIRFPVSGLIPFFRPWCYQTIAVGER